MAIPAVLHYKNDVIPVLTDAGVDVSRLAGRVVIGFDTVEYVVACTDREQWRLNHVVRFIDAQKVLARWSLPSQASVVLFPDGVAQAAVVDGDVVSGWILIDMSDVDVSWVCLISEDPDHGGGGSDRAGAQYGQQGREYGDGLPWACPGFFLVHVVLASGAW